MCRVWLVFAQDVERNVDRCLPGGFTDNVLVGVADDDHRGQYGEWQIRLLFCGHAGRSGQRHRTAS